MAKPQPVHLVTIEKEDGKQRSCDITEYPTVEAARTDMRDYIRSFLDDGYERVRKGNPKKVKPMQLAVTDGDGWVLTCTIVRKVDRKLRKELDLSE